MRATKSYVYAGRRLVEGDYFEAKGNGDAKLLVALRRAERVKMDEIALDADTLFGVRRDEEETEAQPPPRERAPPRDGKKKKPAPRVVEEPAPKRTYKRRDKTAET